ncbi:copper amine oxidase N-terminal domain-containing protein [Bacillus horti]|uniref:Copper amine oxidase-like N-terminal domain-containing protein n=1 Tax=Caldalkalibacillus horti TaxID=77523 RepID=A0ABT9W0X4_9BACI|nr:copper amine oxidase N-terminal domain-containing protein [Bacillus horti]MDQ0166918.1 hypothetical protein [Bacillus horti]
MKKFLPVFLALVLILAACSSTTPALTSVVLDQLEVSQSSYEAKSKIKIKTNLADHDSLGTMPKEMALILKVLEEGIVLDIKQQDLQNAYMKLGFENPATIKESVYWDSEQNPQLEIYTLGESMYFKTPIEDKFFHLDSEAGMNIQGVSQAEINSLNTFIFNAFTDYIEQFDYDLRDIDNKGKVQVSTPGSTKTVNHIQLNMNLEDVKDFISYTLGNLAEYDQLDSIALEYFNLLLSDFVAEEGYGLTDEEITEMVTELRTALREVKAAIDQFDEADIAEQLGFTPDLAIELNYYVTDDAELVKSEMKFDLTLEPTVGGEEPLHILIESEDVYWNVHGNVELPAFDRVDVYDLYELSSDYNELEQIQENSPVRQMIEPLLFPRTATIEIGSPIAMVNHDYVELDAVPYIENGNTMVPISIVTDIAYTEAAWDGENKVITFEFDGKVATVQAGSNVVFVDGTEYEMGVPIEIKNGVAFVPIRLVTKHLGATIYVYDETGLMDIYNEYE